MNNLNSILIEGNMVRDPLLRTTPKGTIVCNFSIASNRFYRQDSNVEKEVGFFDVEAWGKLATACASHGRKGRGVRVVGRLKQDRWVGNDGKNHTRVAIVAEHVEYRSDFKKTSETAFEKEASPGYPDAYTRTGLEAGALAEQATPPDMYGEQMEDTKIEELEAVAF